MSSALILCLILYLMGVAVGAPASTSPEKPKLNLEIEVTAGESPTDSSTSGLSEFEKECEIAWQKFLVDFDVHYKNDSLKPEITKESAKDESDDSQDAREKFLINFRSKHKDSFEAKRRRGVFCGNWRASLEGNVQYDKTTDRALGNQPRIHPAPEISKEEISTSKSKINHDDNTCQAAWEKFMIDFKRKYEDDNETKQRRNIFCDNWNSIQKHNVQYDLGNISFRKGINQWSDLTVEEWKKKQQPDFNTELSKLENTTKISKDINTCQAAWNKFLIDFGPKYSDDTETKKRRNIFCDNWNSIQKHNVQYDLGNISFKKGINQWSDLTVEEWKSKQQPNLSPEFSR
ncbi:uncharacterized protein LOC6549160 [Drosophila erecta]|nr:uncharacterized protein LOC6549160 [Drosophila erecta]